MEADEGEPKQQMVKPLREDSLSALPTFVFHHILSLLPIEDVIKMGFVSKKWKYLWIAAASLVFSFPGEPLSSKLFTSLGDFFQFIDKTLALYSSDKVKKFSVSFKFYESNISALEVHSRVESWLEFATARKVDELHLEPHCCKKLFGLSPFMGFCPGYLMPPFLYENSSLIRLSSRFCDYRSEGHVSWPSLKALTISDAELSEGMLQRILLGSPLLEYLELRHCLYLDNINTSSNPRLKTLVMNRVEGRHGVMEISVPSVTSLEISGWCCPITMFQLSNVSSLIDATLDLELHVGLPGHYDLFGIPLPGPHECQDMLRQLLEKVNHVKNLALGSSIVQALSLLELKALSSPLSNNNRNCLTVATGFDRCDLLGVASLLNSFPYLEKLVIKLNEVFLDEYWFDRDDHPNFSDIDEKNFWAAKERSFECLLMCLKTVEIVDVKPKPKGNVEIMPDVMPKPKGYRIKYAGLFEFAKFILGSARVLERMVLVPEKCSDSEKWDFHGVAYKLSRLPRASPRAVVLVTE